MNHIDNAEIRIYFEDDKGVTQTAETIEKFVKPMTKVFW